MGNNITIIIALILIIGFFYFQSHKTNIIQTSNINQPTTQTTSKEFKRTIPNSVNSGKQFYVTYSTEKTGKWFLIIIDEVSGGCKFPDGSNELKAVMLSTEGNTKTIQVTAPSYGSCTFSGDYNIEGDVLIKFGDQIVQII